MAIRKRKVGKPLTVNLGVAYGDKNLTKVLTKQFSEEIIQKKEVDSTDLGVQVVAFNDSSFLASTLKDAQGILVCNEGEVTAELSVYVAGWTAGTPDANAAASGSVVKKVLHANEFMFLPNLTLFEYSAAGSAGLGASLDNAAPPTDMYVDSGVNLDAKLEDSETLIGVADIAPFEVGDLVQVGINDTTATRIEVMEVTSITDDSGTDNDGAGNLHVKRALYGTSAADGDNQTNAANGAVSGANVHFPIFNAYYDYNTILSGDTQLIMSDGQGRFKANNFFGYARTALANDEAKGLVNGSVALKFYNSAYHEVKFAKPITSNTDSKVTASTAYEFDLTIDDSSATAIVFTTSANTRFGGTDGIIAKMQTAIDTAFEGTAFGCTVAIVDGKLRFTSNSHMAPHDSTNGSKVLVEDRSGSTGADLFTGSVGIMPNDTAFPSPVAASLPDDLIIDSATGRTTSNNEAFMYDDGLGNLIYKGAQVGTISYRSGAIDFTIPELPYAQFVLNAAYDSALSGGVNVKSSHADNGIASIFARSTNTKINTTIGIYAFN